MCLPISRCTPAHTQLCSAVFDQKQHDPPPTITHCPYSPNLALSNFVLFPQMKSVLTGKGLVDVKEVKQKMAEALEGIKIDELKNCFEQWKKTS